jgi:hypothetical protein
MNGISSTIQRCKLQLKLDNPTEGYGNCFPNAIVQQCRRPEIQDWLLENKPWVIVKSQQALRRQVKNFALKSAHKTIHDYKTNYEAILKETDETWNDYWDNMGHDGTWVDSVFVQLTAWYIGLDIKILTTSSKPGNPYIIVTGDINISTASSFGPPLLLGNYTNVHYQSLLPLSLAYEAKPAEQNTGKDTTSAKDDFIYLHKGEQLTFPVLNSDKLQCPFCNKSFSRITSHIPSLQCFISKANIDLKQFTVQLDSYREGFRLEMGRKRKQKSQAKLMNERGKDNVKKEHNETQKKVKPNLKQREAMIL